MNPTVKFNYISISCCSLFILLLLTTLGKCQSSLLNTIGNTKFISGFSPGYTQYFKKGVLPPSHQAKAYLEIRLIVRGDKRVPIDKVIKIDFDKNITTISGFQIYNPGYRQLVMKGEIRKDSMMSLLLETKNELKLNEDSLLLCLIDSGIFSLQDQNAFILEEQKSGRNLVDPCSFIDDCQHNYNTVEIKLGELERSFRISPLNYYSCNKDIGLLKNWSTINDVFNFIGAHIDFIRK